MTDLELLGLPEGSRPDEIKTKWRQLAKAHHPDYGGDAEQFQLLRQAYERAYATANRPKRCPRCSGKGRVTTNHGFATVSLTCQQCKGTGEVRL